MVVSFSFALVAAKGIATRCEDMGAVGQAVEQRRGELLVAEHFDPLGEGQVSRDDGGTALVTLRQQIEQQLAACALERNEPQLIDD